MTKKGNIKHQKVAVGQGGFTIIELLIATVVFASVLLLLTMGVLSFTKSYFRGVNQSATQNAARVIIEDVTEAIQFSGSAITSPVSHSTTAAGGPVGSTLDFNNPWSQGFCLGNQLYSYVTGWQLVDGTANTTQHETNHGLMRSSPGNCGGMAAQDVRVASPAGTELLSPRMRLAKMAVSPTGDPTVWRVAVRVVYGDDDLLCSPSVPGDCDSNSVSTSLDKDDLTCKNFSSGTQFCAASELSSIVKRRITSGP